MPVGGGGRQAQASRREKTIQAVMSGMSAQAAKTAMAWPWVRNWAPCPPDPFQRTTEWGGQGAQFLTHGQAIAVFATWALIPLIAAWFVFSRRDA